MARVDALAGVTRPLANDLLAYLPLQQERQQTQQPDPVEQKQQGFKRQQGQGRGLRL